MSSEIATAHPEFHDGATWFVISGTSQAAEVSPDGGQDADGNHYIEALDGSMWNGKGLTGSMSVNVWADQQQPGFGADEMARAGDHGVAR